MEEGAPKPKIFLDILTPDSRALLIFFTKTGIPAIRQDIDIGNNKNMTAEYRRISPNMKCPVLKHENVVIEDTIQIMKYFSKKAFQIEEGHRIKDLYNLKNRMEVIEIDFILEKYK